MKTTSKKWWGLAAIGALGTLFQFPTPGCAGVGADALFAAFDFCAVLNCQGGTFFNFCDPILLFVDCL